MCDTMVVLGNATVDGAVIFAKNSDREPNEAHHLFYVPPDDYMAGKMVRCTYVSIPQVRHTHGVLLAKPFWIWGAEMGANDQGLVIGNEAVFTRVPHNKEAGLIGMDYIRLALERANTAEQALEVMTELLEKHGQGGNCGYRHSLFYDNSYLLADRKEAWVLETAGTQWAAVKVQDVRSISNVITIESEWDLSSKSLVDFAVKQGWCKKAEEFSFRRCYSDWLYTRFSDAQRRYACSSDLLKGLKGKMDVKQMMNILRTHRLPSTPDWSPEEGGLTGADICMHASWGPVRGSQSVGSMVSHLGPGEPTHWVTGTSAPCTGIFKPIWMDAGLPEMGSIPNGEYNPTSMFWKHEVLHRSVLLDYAGRLAAYRERRDDLEAEFIAGALAVSGDTFERGEFSRDCFQREDDALVEWTDQVQRTPVRRSQAFFHALGWKKFNREAKISVK